MTAPHQVRCREGLETALHWRQRREPSLTGLPPGRQFHLRVTPPITVSPSATRFLGQVVVRDTAIEERDPVSLYFQFALCPYAPCPVACLGSEEGRCSRRPGRAGLGRAGRVAGNHWSVRRAMLLGGGAPGSPPQAASFLRTAPGPGSGPAPAPLQTASGKRVWGRERAAALQLTPR